MIDKLNLSETTSQAERQRRYIFFYTCAGYMAGILWSFFSDAAPRTTFYHSINALHLGLLLVLMLLFLSEKATTEKLTALFLVITQAEISFEMIYEAVSKSHTANLVIIGNMVLLALLLILLALLGKKKVRFETSGGTELEAVSVKRGGVIGEVMTPTKPGAVFGGWYADQALTKPWDTQKDPVRSNMTLYARWM